MNDINTVLQREREKYKVRSFYLLGFVGCISIFIYFFLLLSNGTKIIILPEEARINAKVKSENFLDLSFNNFIYSFYSTPVFSLSSKGYEKIIQTILTIMRIILICHIRMLQELGLKRKQQRNK